jgi:hypothetical protein
MSEYSKMMYSFAVSTISITDLALWVPISEVDDGLGKKDVQKS